MARTTARYFDLLDGVWDEIRLRLPNPFTTQDFQYRIEEAAPHVWAEFVERWGQGGKGSGKFYSPANVLNNYLKEKTRNAVLLNNRFVPSAKGWGSVVVNQWQFIGAEVLPASEEDWEFAEGKSVLRLHLFKERDVGVRKHLLKARATTGLSCDICGVNGDHLDDGIREAMFEAHHSTQPIKEGERKTTKDDVALLCACCHRLIHRLITVKGKWVTVAEAKKDIGARRG